MKLSQLELGVVVATIVYIAFFTHPPPVAITQPAVHIVALLGILYVVLYQNLVVGLFLGIAYVVTISQSGVTEYLDPAAQNDPTSAEPPAATKPKVSATATKPKVSAPPAVPDISKTASMLEAITKASAAAKPAAAAASTPTPAVPATVEKFSLF
jgi:hypothetical protein